MNLSPEQQDVFDTIVGSNRNVFVTGGPGSGKSHVIRSLKNPVWCGGRRYDMTASTGPAAAMCEGMTFHSWSGISETADFESLIRRLKGHVRDGDGAGHRIATSEGLVIDEISMISPELLDFFDRVCRAIRNHPNAAFGGLQVVAVGDFYQIPPVKKRQCPGCGGKGIQDAKGVYTCSSMRGKWCKTGHWDTKTRYCFEPAYNGATPWEHAAFVFKELTEIHRQTDPTFIEFVRRLRVGKPSEEDIDLLYSRTQKRMATPYTHLFCHVRRVTEHNEEAMSRLDPSTEHSYTAVVSDNHPGKWLLEDHKNKTIRVRTGQVCMLTKNVDPAGGLYNGALCVISGFDESGYPIAEFDLPSGPFSHVMRPETWTRDIGPIRGTLSQVPLMPAAGMTVNKAQGATLTRVVVSLDGAWQPSQILVAISRATGFEGLKIQGDIDFDKAYKNADLAKVTAFYDACRREYARKRKRVGDDENDHGTDETHVTVELAAAFFSSIDDEAM